MLLLLATVGVAQSVTVTAQVKTTGAKKRSRARDIRQVVVWLTPVEAPAARPASRPDPVPRLTQKNKSFEPHLLVIPVGSVVEFPNHDPFFHNVFSLFEGKRFDLGLYEAGSTRQVHFDKPGISYIFCNIHPEMSAVVIALSTPYYAVSDKHGQVTIPNVPLGAYKLQVWHESAVPESLNSVSREVEISTASSDLGVLRIPTTGPQVAHKNKYGKDYDPPTPDSPGYQQQ